MNSRPTLKELSAMTGVSMATISRALSNPGKVRPATRMRIEAAIREFRQKSSSGRSGLIGMIVPDIANEFFPLMLSGVEGEGSESGCTVMLCSCNGQMKAEERALRKLLDIGVDGIIYITSGSAPPLLKETIASGALPVIFLDRDPGIPGTALITTDNRNGMLQAARYLATLGHRRILYLGGSEGTSTEMLRWQGFREAMDSAGIIEDETGELHAGFSASAAYEAVKDLIASGGFGYTAIAAANDVMALGALKAIREARKRVPEDVSIIGFDNNPLGRVVYPALSTIGFDSAEYARFIAEILLDGITTGANASAGNSTPLRSRILSPVLIERDSVR